MPPTVKSVELTHAVMGLVPNEAAMMECEPPQCI